jgi:hypothetical protein
LFCSYETTTEVQVVNVYNTDRSMLIKIATSHKVASQTTPQMPRKNPALPVDTKSDSYVCVAEFRSRISWINATVLSGQRSEFGDQVLSQRPTHHTTPPLELSDCLDKLLRGKSRIYPASAGHAVNLRQNYLSMRDVLRSMNDQLAAQIERSRHAMQRLEALSPLTYVVEVEHEMQFAEAVRYQVTSPQYLDWVAGYTALSRHDQHSVRTYCEVEGDWWWRTEGALAYPSYVTQSGPVEEDVATLLAQGSHELAEMRLQMSSAAQELLDTRSAPNSGEWLWLQPWGVNALPWPATGTLSGSESGYELEHEARYWDALGKSLSCLPFDAIIDSACQTPESIETYRVATQAWAECVDAGQTVRRLASVLRACVLTIKVPVCDCCFRYVGAGQHRRCHVHVTRSTERTQATRAAGIAQKYHAKLADLQHELRNSVIYGNAVNALSACWKVRLVAGSAGSVAQANAAFDRLGDGLRMMIKLLKPVVGSDLHQRLVALAELLQSKASQVIENNGQVANTDVLVGAEQRSTVEGALRSLTPPGFFAIWFGGCVFDGASSMVYQGTDPSHPLLHLPTRTRSRSHRKTPVYAFSLNAVLNDLLRHRAWMEIGGESVDQLIARGQTLPSDRTRPQMDVSLAKELRNKGFSFRHIAEELGVSGAAVHTALNKTTPTTTTSKAHS